MRVLPILLTLCLAACGGDDDTASADAEGCEHLQDGPDVDRTATATAAGAPGVLNDHMRYDITLVPVTGGNGGVVAFAAPEAGGYIFFLDATVPFAISDATGAPVTLEDSATSSTACADIKGRHVADLAVGTYNLSFGPTTATAVSLVIEEEAHEE